MSRGVRFVGVLGEQGRELLLAQPREQLRRGFAVRRVHPHVEGPRLLVAEAAIGLVDLHRRHAEVREDHVRGREPLRGEHLRQTREVALARDERLGAEADGAQARFGAWQLERIDVEPDQASAGLHAFEDRLRMTAATERAVDRDVAGRRPQAADHLVDHDRSMRACGWSGLVHRSGSNVTTGV